MRELKFKAWLPCLSKMTHAGTIEDITKWAPLGCTPIWLQFTGLKDKNGNEIYEGDIVKWGHLPTSKEYQVRIAAVKINPDIQLDCKNIAVPYVFHWGQFAYSSKQLEIIGNIYEHPDLITK